MFIVNLKLYHFLIILNFRKFKTKLIFKQTMFSKQFGYSNNRSHLNHFSSNSLIQNFSMTQSPQQKRRTRQERQAASQRQKTRQQEEDRIKKKRLVDMILQPNPNIQYKTSDHFSITQKRNQSNLKNRSSYLNANNFHNKRRVSIIFGIIFARLANEESSPQLSSNTQNQDHFRKCYQT